jgi:predicted nucleotide-binding protein
MPQLTVERSWLDVELHERIRRGEDLVEALDPPIDANLLRLIRNGYDTWDEYNQTLLQRSFTTSKPADSYRALLVAWDDDDESPSIEIKLREVIQGKIRRLVSLKGQLPLFDESPATPARQEEALTAESSTEDKTAVFVVHGHSEVFKEQVARFFDTATDLEPIILHEQANSGRTIIEKFEDYAGKAAFAVVLLTADDEGGIRGSAERGLRARQNVVFELGFFIAALGRSRVAVLYEEGVELPSDMSGVLYTALDVGGAWKLALGKELRAAKLRVDLNLV